MYELWFTRMKPVSVTFVSRIRSVCICVFSQILVSSNLKVPHLHSSSWTLVERPHVIYGPDLLEAAYLALLLNTLPEGGANTWLELS